MEKRIVDVESPYMGKSESEYFRNIRYARACIRDCLLRDEIPFASHLFYTQPGILDDNVEEDRKRGIDAGKTLLENLNADTIVYTDLGISRGMQFGIDLATQSSRTIEYRSLGKDWESKFREVESTHSHKGVWGI